MLSVNLILQRNLQKVRQLNFKVPHKNFHLITLLIFSGSLTTVIVIIVSVLGLLLIIIVLCIFKQRRARRVGAANVIKTDENATYGDYSDPDPRMEVEDTNDYYSSDYEAGTGTSKTTDNNPYYE